MKLSRVLAASLAVALCATTLARAQNPEFRGIWVDAWGTGFLNASQVTQFLAGCRAYNATGLQSTSADFTCASNPPGVVNDVVVEARLAGGAWNSNPPYSDSGFADSTLKSTAAGLGGTGSRYGSSGSPSFTI